MSAGPIMSDRAGTVLADLYAPIAAELAASERIFAEELSSRLPHVQALVDHSAGFRGKRVRPALLLLSGKACGGTTPEHATLAAVVEMIHTATLVHDDILDEAIVRRHTATVNTEWGNETAVLLGDYLFTHAFHLAASVESTQACRWIGRATNRVCEGEMHQVHNRGNLDLDEENYLAIIRGKTAELTAVSCRLGAYYSGASPELVDRLETFGRELGVAFQIADDLLDLCGEERVTGKSLGTDLIKQKLTLPIIRHLATAAPDQAEIARRLLADPNSRTRSQLRPLLEFSGTLAYASERAEEAIRTALDAIAPLAPSPAKARLEQMAALALRRSN